MNKRLLALFFGMVLLTAISLACSTSRIQNLFTTPTPTPRPTGTGKTYQTDGSVVFTDYDNQYEITFPQAWTTIDLKSDDLTKMAEIVAKNNPDLENLFSMLKNMDSNVFRIFAFDFRPEHIVEGNTSSINIGVQNDDVSYRSTLQMLVDMNSKSLPQIYPGSTLLASKVTKSGSGMPIGVIESTFPLTNALGSSTILYGQQVFIKVGTSVVIITFVTPSSLQKILLPEFNGIINTFKILE